MVKPIKLFLILFLLIVAIAIPSFLVSQNEFVIGNYSLKYPSVYQLFDFDSAGSASTIGLDPDLVRLDLFIDSISLDVPLDTISEIIDTVCNDADTLVVRGKPEEINLSLTAEVLKNRKIKIEFPDSSHSALEPFFLALQGNLPSRQLIRVLHFGDSQIEGDRISSFLRARLQNRFGGRGVGLVHAVPHSYQPGAIRQSNSSNWQKILLPDMGKGAVENRFGILGGYSVFSSKKFFSKGGFAEAWIRFQRIGSVNSSARNFSKCRVFHGFNAEPFLLSISYDDKVADAEMVEPSKMVNQTIWDVPVSKSSFQIDFKGDESPMVYGISLESSSGIVVDNIPIRGSSGTDFTRSDDATLKRFMSLLNVRLIILQFGVNIVPNVVESYKYYENQLYNQIVTLKKLNPKAAVILIGVSDMSRKEGGRFVSYSNIPKIRDAQRNAAFRAGAAFWDCYQAMGGENSMTAWVNATPALASKDFVHFSLRGSNLIAEMFYSSLMAEYDNFVNNVPNTAPKKEVIKDGDVNIANKH